jgi:hypothetical protein
MSDVIPSEAKTKRTRIENGLIFFCVGNLNLTIVLGDVHILRNAIFQLFRLPLLVTKNHTNPYVLTMVRNKSLSPLSVT